MLYCLQLRFNKVSELIHNSTNHKNLEQARVTVFFQEILDQVGLHRSRAPRSHQHSLVLKPAPCLRPLQPGDAFEIIPGSQFTVSRTAHRNNSSDYYIDGRKVSTKDVTEKLKGQGIDLDNNRFLILQVQLVISQELLASLLTVTATPTHRHRVRLSRSP